jgi:hypothetical protein
MKLSAKLHGVLDYVIGSCLIIFSQVKVFDDQFIFGIISFYAGIAIILNNIFTNYELGLVKLYSMEIHLIIDMILAVFLITSTWLFVAEGKYLILLLVVSVFEAITSFITKSSPLSSRKTNNFKSLKIDSY